MANTSGSPWTDLFRASPEATEPCRAAPSPQPLGVDAVVRGILQTGPRCDDDLGEVLDVDADTVARWRAGAPTPFELWPRLEATYGLDPGELSSLPIDGTTLGAHLAALEASADQLDVDPDPHRLDELRAGLEAIDRILGRTPDRALAGRYAVLAYCIGRTVHALPPA